MASDAGYQVQFAKSAGRELARQKPNLRRAIRDAIERLKRDPTPAFSKRLEGYTEPHDPPLYRIKLEEFNYRIVYTIRQHRLLIVVLKMGDRSEVYAELARMMGRGSSLRRGRR